MMKGSIQEEIKFEFYAFKNITSKAKPDWLRRTNWKQSNSTEHFLLQ